MRNTKNYSKNCKKNNPYQIYKILTQMRTKKAN